MSETIPCFVRTCKKKAGHITYKNPPGENEPSWGCDTHTYLLCDDCGVLQGPHGWCPFSITASSRLCKACCRDVHPLADAEYGDTLGPTKHEQHCTKIGCTKAACYCENQACDFAVCCMWGHQSIFALYCGDHSLCPACGVLREPEEWCPVSYSETPMHICVGCCTEAHPNREKYMISHHCTTKDCRNPVPDPEEMKNHSSYDFGFCHEHQPK
jgi:hypothetical protein